MRAALEVWLAQYGFLKTTETVTKNPKKRWRFQSGLQGVIALLFLLSGGMKS